MAYLSTAPGADAPRVQLRELARDLACYLAAMEPAQSKELLGEFISELCLSTAEQSRPAERRQKQASGIAAAKARGVRFGRPAPLLPENFDDLHRTWRAGGMTLQQAADACGLTRSSFYNAAVRREQNPAV